MKRIIYTFLNISSFIRRSAGRRLTKAGQLAAAGLVLFAVFGLDTNKNVAYQGFTLLLALVLVSIASCYFFRASITIRRTLPRFGTTGQALNYRVFVTNSGGKTLQGIGIAEDFPDHRPSYAELIGRYKDDRILPKRPVYGEWNRLIRINRRANEATFPLPELPARAEVEVNAEVMPLKRGRLTFLSATLMRPDPFGLLNAFIRVPSEQSVLILPKRYPLPAIDLPGNRAYQHGGVTLSTSVADSEEFQALREYRAGDPVRRIDWKGWARIGKPVIREYQDEFFVRHALVLDTFTKDGAGAALEEAVSLAASLACSVHTQESLLDLMFVGAETYCETIGRGQGQVERMLEVLACVQPCADKRFSALHGLVVSKRDSLSGCICIFIAWDDERRGFLNHLKRLGVPVTAFVVAERGDIAGSITQKDRTMGLHVLEAGKIMEGLAKL